MKLSVTFELDEVDEVMALVSQLGATAANAPMSAYLANETTQDTPPKPVHDAVRLLQLMESNESPRLLEALTTEPLTFEELSQLMPLPNGQVHTVGGMRAIYRNVRRKEKGLTAAGIISGPVVQADFSVYDQDAAGRYYLEADARAALNAFLSE